MALDSDAWVEFLGVFVEGFPDLRLEVLDSSADRGTVAQRILFTGTHSGPLRGLRSGPAVASTAPSLAGHEAVGEAAAHEPVMGRGLESQIGRALPREHPPRAVGRTDSNPPSAHPADKPR